MLLCLQDLTDAAGQRYQTAQQAVRAFAAAAGPAHFQEGLQTLATILQNAQSHTDQKFRRVREQNAAYHRKAGQYAAAGDILRAAGFHRQGPDSDPVWVLQTPDPGLLWLVSSAILESL